YGNLAVQQLEQGVNGVMMALSDGKYTTVPIDSCIKGEKRVDVAELYDAENYRPRISHVMGKPMFLY
ncbi:phosphofructokinase, partial [bacterium]|nr:phosphofructokinase [bacterium]